MSENVEMKLKAVKSVAAKVARADKRREALVFERDQLLVEAREAGATWVQLQSAGGFGSPRSVVQALERAASRR